MPEKCLSLAQLITSISQRERRQISSRSCWHDSKRLRRERVSSSSLTENACRWFCWAQINSKSKQIETRLYWLMKRSLLLKCCTEGKTHHSSARPCRIRRSLTHFEDVDWQVEERAERITRWTRKEIDFVGRGHENDQREISAYLQHLRIVDATVEQIPFRKI